MATNMTLNCSAPAQIIKQLSSIFTSLGIKFKADEFSLFIKASAFSESWKESTPAITQTQPLFQFEVQMLQIKPKTYLFGKYLFMKYLTAQT
jgi:hypothetical protein